MFCHNVQDTFSNFKICKKGLKIEKFSDEKCIVYQKTCDEVLNFFYHDEGFSYHVNVNVTLGKYHHGTLSQYHH